MSTPPRMTSTDRERTPEVASASFASCGSGAGRLVSLDAYRGAIMLLMASSALSLPKVAESFPESRIWRLLGHELDHATWAGCTLWDLIQPAFMFMVGVALPWSIANRKARGQGAGARLGHAIWRSTALVLLAIFLTSAWSSRTEWIFPSVLAQIGLGYPFLYLLVLSRLRVQWVGAFAILAGYWLAFALHPVAPADLDWASVGVPAGWTPLEGFEAHWEKGFNFAATVDRWLLNLFPREAPFLYNEGGYQTLNFVPSLATMLFGTLAGQLLRAEAPIGAKVRRLVLGGMVGIALGGALHLLGLCPIVKRIWTPSWTLFSGGIVTLLLAAFVAVVDGLGWRRWAFPFVVAGLNPITLYCLWQLSGGFTRESLRRHLGPEVFDFAGATWKPLLERLWVLVVYWLILLWMYRRRIFVRL